MQGVILQGSSKSLIVDTMMTVETLILGINQGLPEGGVNIVVAYRGTVLAKELANLFAIGTENHRSLGWALVLDGAHRGALTKQPQEVHVNGS